MDTTKHQEIQAPLPFHLDVTDPAKECFQSSNFLVVKLTDYCNLSCKYCHQDALSGKPILMPMETFKNAVRLILSPSRAPVVYIQFHGGEPLLASEDFFREAVAFAKETLNQPGRQVRFAIQTNLTRVTPAREAWLKELGIWISYSLDGPPELNDELRGGGKQIVENWRRMRKNATQAGTICLIQPSNGDQMERVLEFFDQEGIHRVRFNLMVPDGRGMKVDPTTTSKLFEAKKTILDFMLKTNGQSVVDLTLVRAMKRMMKMNGAPSSFEYQGCESFYCQAGRSLYSVNPDGRFYACDRIAESQAWAMGSVNRPFTEFELNIAKKMRSAFHHKDEWWARCEGCDAKKICEFSCSAYYVDKVDTRETECQYTKRMWKYFIERREDIREFLGQYQDQAQKMDDSASGELKASSESKAVRALSRDAFYNQLSEVETLASNARFQLFRKEGKYFIYLNKRDRLFEVDSVVAEIARFNGCLSPSMMEAALGGKFLKKELRETLQKLSEQIPEILFDAQVPSAGQAHALRQQQPYVMEWTRSVVD